MKNVLKKNESNNHVETLKTVWDAFLLQTLFGEGKMN